MEESEKRMERLRAMRLEAEQTGRIDNQGASTASGSLANPLIDSSPTQSFVESSVPVRRFDYYTDPAAAFSENRRRRDVDHHTSASHMSSPMNRPSSLSGPMNPYMNPAPRPTHQFRGNYFPDQRPNMQQIPWTSPVGSANPYDQRPCGTPVPWGSPVAHHGMSPSNPAAWNRYSGSSGNRPPFNPTRGGFSSPRMVHAGGSSNYSGRGRGGRYSYNPSPGRGRGSHATVSAMEHPELFYKKNMVEDPWRFLKPIVRHVGSGKNASWLPKSVSTKKARVSEGSSSFQVHGSLAEFLACSFEEAANEAEGS
ncbi:hypothetical protein QJS10_CPA05g01484 [Acorus calamus]|uniref:Uncharacterized protein n=1 Tax=Acorus calamus TaxID=4465 RepID=A0AAV9ET67_ACOCL|nr:hypothetical protein QJS10_CPA05g01484 [Acorus calamus]